MEAQKTNISFGFLNPDNPYHAFYEHQLEQCINNKCITHINNLYIRHFRR